MFNKNICVFDDIIKSKTSSLLNEEKPAQTENNQTQLQLSKRWLQKLKARNNFKRFCSHRESFSLDLKNVTEKLPEIVRKISKYAINDI